MARIEMRKLAHSYLSQPRGDEDYALKRMQHTWDDGGAYALLGPSGCGKTTLLNITSGLLTPSEGEVLFDGRPVTAMPPEARNIAQVFQFPVIYDTMTVYDNLAFPLRNRRINEGHVRRRVEAVAEMLELTPLLKRRANNLGADEKQLISMGRGLVREDVAAILFDEPLTVIDPHLKWVLRRKLREIHAEFGHTLIYVTHDQTEAMTFADQVVVMTDGRVVQTGTPQDLFEAPRHTFVGYFIGSPGMNIVPCTVADGEAHLGEFRVRLDPVLADRARDLPGSLELGIRPELLEVADPKATDAVPATVRRVEDLGSFRLIEATVGALRFAVTAPEESREREGDVIGLRFPTEWTRLYHESELVEWTP